MRDISTEQWELTCDRIRQIEQEQLVEEPFRTYFASLAGLISLYVEEYDYVSRGGMQKAGWGSSTMEKEYWEKNGWLGKERPWK